MTDWDAVEGRQADQKWLNPQRRRLGLRPFVKEYTIGPDGAKVPLYTYTGTPIYSRGGIYKRLLTDLYELRNWIPLSSYSRDPWWWSYSLYSPFDDPYLSLRRRLFYLRDRYLSPFKSTYWRRYLSTPIYSRGGIYKRPLTDLYEPRNWIPLSRFSRDPWWWAYPQYKPFEAPYLPMRHSPFYLRDSYLSPIKNTYLWRDHPIRPFSTTPRLNF